jgi:hypothetical protein
LGIRAIHVRMSWQGCSGPLYDTRREGQVPRLCWIWAAGTSFCSTMADRITVRRSWTRSGNHDVGKQSMVVRAARGEALRVLHKLQGRLSGSPGRSYRLRHSINGSSRSPPYRLLLEQACSQKSQAHQLSILVFDDQHMSHHVLLVYALKLTRPLKLIFKMTTDYSGGFANSRQYLKPRYIASGMDDSTSSESSAASPPHSNVWPAELQKLDNAELTFLIGLGKYISRSR